jgi:hypothetical protein
MRSGPSAAQAVSALGIAPGEYLCSPTKLWYVESLTTERAVLEDCATGELINVPLNTLLALRRVRRTAL